MAPHKLGLVKHLPGAWGSLFWRLFLALSAAQLPQLGNLIVTPGLQGSHAPIRTAGTRQAICSQLDTCGRQCIMSLYRAGAFCYKLILTNVHVGSDTNAMSCSRSVGSRCKQISGMETSHHAAQPDAMKYFTRKHLHVLKLVPAPTRVTSVEALAAAVAAASVACMIVDRGASETPEQASTKCMAIPILSWTSSTSGNTSTSALECGTSWRCVTTCHIRSCLHSMLWAYYWRIGAWGLAGAHVGGFLGGQACLAWQASIQ